MRIKPHVTYFIIPTLLALLLGGFFLVAYSKTDIHLYINSLHSVSGDYFFRIVTHLGDGWIFFFTIPALLFISYRGGLQIALTGLFTGMITGILKNFVFHEAPRPVKYFREIAELYLVPGVEINLINSFPSGHTMAAFSFYFALALLVKNKWASLLFFVFAFLIGYSRMYLSQHFLVDVIAGAGLGICCATGAYLLANRIKSSNWDKNLFDLLKGKRG